MSGVFPPHRKRYAIEGHARYLTFSCFGNQPFLSRERPCRWFLERLDSLHAQGGFQLWAYVIMPTHCHLLVVPRNPEWVGDFLYGLKKSVANRAIAWVTRHHPDLLERMADVQPSGKRCFRLWQPGGGYDRNIISVEEAHEKIHYIHANPVRSGLVEHPSQWQWSSYRAWTTGQDIPIRIDRDSLPPLPQ